MDLEFRTRKLERCFDDERVAARTWGAQVGNRYQLRCKQLQAFESWTDAQTFRAFRLHALSGDRAGSWALTLQGRWRLIVIPDQRRNSVRIEEVSNHYGD